MGGETFSLEGICTAGDRHRKVVSGDGNPATKTSGIGMTTLEFVGERGRVKTTKSETRVIVRARMFEYE